MDPALKLRIDQARQARLDKALAARIVLREHTRQVLREDLEAIKPGRHIPVGCALCGSTDRLWDLSLVKYPETIRVKLPEIEFEEQPDGSWSEVETFKIITTRTWRTGTVCSGCLTLEMKPCVQSTTRREYV